MPAARRGPHRGPTTSRPRASTQNTDAVLRQLGERLGLPRNSSPQQIVDAARRVLASQAAPPPDGELPPPRGAGRVEVIDWAQRTGRITASSRSTWERNWTRDPVSADATLRILAPGVAPSAGVAAAGPSGPVLSGPGAGGAGTASGLDVSSLPPATRAVVAREGDRGRAFALVERFAGYDDESVAVEAQIIGDVALAGAVRQEMQVAASAAAQGWVDQATQAAEAARVADVARVEAARAADSARIAADRADRQKAADRALFPELGS